MEATVLGLKPPPNLFVLVVFILGCSNREWLLACTPVPTAPFDSSDINTSPRKGKEAFYGLQMCHRKQML